MLTHFMPLLSFYTSCKHKEKLKWLKWNLNKMSFQSKFLNEGYTCFSKQLHYWFVIIIVKVITVFIRPVFAKD